MPDGPCQSEASALAKRGLVSVLSAALALNTGCHSGQAALRADSPADSSGSSKTAAKVRSLTDRKFERTPERLARGRYLVNGIGELFGFHGPLCFDTPGRA